MNGSPGDVGVTPSRDRGVVVAVQPFILSASRSKGDKVALVGFGSFSISRRAARTGRNPQTGATIQVSAWGNDPYWTRFRPLHTIETIDRVFYAQGILLDATDW